MPHHLAQINIARLLEPLDSPRLQEFVDNLDRINALAESSPGFVWRLRDENNNATSLQVFDDPLIIVNMSMWTSWEALKDYVYGTAHVDILRKRLNWFERMNEPHTALWWVPVGQTPDGREGRRRLEFLRRNGPTDYAFSLQVRFPPPGEDQQSIAAL